VIYRQTENILRKLTARRQAILAAAFDVAAEQGLAAVQIVAIAEQAGIAAGTVYRYFPSKAELIAVLADAFSGQELTALQAAARAAPGPLSALAAAIMTFALRAVAHRRLFFALTAEPAEAEIDAARARFRGALVAELRTLIARAADGGGLADQDPALLAPALFGGLVDSLAGPMAVPPHDAAKARDQARQLTLFALRGLGVPDARARGLVVQAEAQVEDSIGRLYSRMLCNQ
jgi:AcrR family transcriptional regulator